MVSSGDGEGDDEVKQRISYTHQLTKGKTKERHYGEKTSCDHIRRVDSALPVHVA